MFNLGQEASFPVSIIWHHDNSGAAEGDQHNGHHETLERFLDDAWKAAQGLKLFDIPPEADRDEQIKYLEGEVARYHQRQGITSK